jgi:hypothetical protein
MTEHSLLCTDESKQECDRSKSTWIQTPPYNQFLSPSEDLWLEEESLETSPLPSPEAQASG